MVYILLIYLVEIKCLMIVLGWTLPTSSFSKWWIVNSWRCSIETTQEICPQRLIKRNTNRNGNDLKISRYNDRKITFSWNSSHWKCSASISAIRSPWEGVFEGECIWIILAVINEWLYYHMQIGQVKTFSGKIFF